MKHILLFRYAYSICSLYIVQVTELNWTFTENKAPITSFI